MIHIKFKKACKIQQSHISNNKVNFFNENFGCISEVSSTSYYNQLCNNIKSHHHNLITQQWLLLGSAVQLGDGLARSQYSTSVMYVNTLPFFKFVIRETTWQAFPLAFQPVV